VFSESLNKTSKIVLWFEYEMSPHILMCVTGLKLVVQGDLGVLFGEIVENLEVGVAGGSRL
jgi:hypothetical protein